MRVMEPGAWLGAMVAGGMPMGHRGATMIAGVYKRRRRDEPGFVGRVMSLAQIRAETAESRRIEQRSARNAMASASRKRHRRVRKARFVLDYKAVAELFGIDCQAIERSLTVSLDRFLPGVLDFTAGPMTMAPAES